MTGVFVKLPEILRYFDGHFDELIAGEPFYYEEWVLCSAITKRTTKKIELGLCMVGRKEDEETHKPLAPKPHEIPGSLTIAANGELLIDKFTCKTCTKDTCEHVAALIWFLNRHNINRFQKFKPDEVKDARDMVIKGRYDARPLSSIKELFGRCQDACEYDSDEESEDMDGDEPQDDSDEDLGNEELNSMSPRMKRHARVIKNFISQLNNPAMGPFMMSRMQEMSNEVRTKSVNEDEEMGEASDSADQPSTSKRKKIPSAHQIIAALEDNKDAKGRGIYIVPPEVREDTDEDSGDEEGGNINNLPGRMLNAEAALTGNDDNSDDEDADDEYLTQATSTIASTSLKLKIPDYNAKHMWCKQDINKTGAFVTSLEDMKHQVFYGPTFCDKPLTPLEIVELYLDHDILEHIVKQSVIYSVQQGRSGYTFSVEELRSFLGIILVSGYNIVPRQSMYWEDTPDVINLAISQAMGHNVFENIMRNLHFNDNTKLDKSDRLSKLRPLISHLNKKFLEFCPWENKSSIDEAMIEYFGHHGLKQHIRNKPIRFGFKSWCHNLALGYMIQFDIYQGATVVSNEFRKDLGLGGSVVTAFATNLPSDGQGEALPHELFADNFFLSLKLCQVMSANKIGITGTIRQSRIENCPLTDAKELKKIELGMFDYRVDTSSNTLFCRWNGNSVVTLASNCESILPLKSVTCYKALEKRKVKIRQPKLIRSYNRNICGTDRMDQNIRNYRSCIRSKKWWWPILLWLIDATIQNAWHLHVTMEKYTGKKMDLLDFRRSVANALLSKNDTQRSRAGLVSRGIQSRRCDHLRYDQMNHTIIKTEKRLRCGQCKSHTIFKCVKCNVPLHTKCFSEYHK